MKTESEINEILAQQTGTSGYQRHMFGMLFTDGIAELAEAAGAYWLIDAIASYQSKSSKRMIQACGAFQLWELAVDLVKKTAVLTCRADSETPVLIRQKIQYTDFPLASIKLYVESGERRVLLLPSEH